MGVTLCSPSLSFSLSFCPLLADRPLPPQVTLKRSGVNGPAFAYCHHIKMTLFGVIFVDTPSSSWPLRHLYSLLPRGLFLLWPQAPTRVNRRVSNPVALFKLPGFLTHFCAAEMLMCTQAPSFFFNAGFLIVLNLFLPIGLGMKLAQCVRHCLVLSYAWATVLCGNIGLPLNPL